MSYFFSFRSDSSRCVITIPPHLPTLLSTGHCQSKAGWDSVRASDRTAKSGLQTMLKGGDAAGMDYEATCMALVAVAVCLEI